MHSTLVVRGPPPPSFALEAFSSGEAFYYECHYRYMSTRTKPKTALERIKVARYYGDDGLSGVCVRVWFASVYDSSYYFLLFLPGSLFEVNNLNLIRQTIRRLQTTVWSPLFDIVSV